MTLSIWKDAIQDESIIIKIIIACVSVSYRAFQIYHRLIISSLTSDIKHFVYRSVFIVIKAVLQYF